MNNCTVCGDEFTKPLEEGLCLARYERCDECYSEGLLADLGMLHEVLETAQAIQNEEN